MKSDSPATAVQIQQVAELLGLAVLRWQRERERSEKVSNSLPERLELSPETSLSVTGRRDPATCSVVASSESEIGSERLERRTTEEHRQADGCGNPSSGGSRCSTIGSQRESEAANAGSTQTGGCR